MGGIPCPRSVKISDNEAYHPSAGHATALARPSRAVHIAYKGFGHRFSYIYPGAILPGHSINGLNLSHDRGLGYYYSPLSVNDSDHFIRRWKARNLYGKKPGLTSYNLFYFRCFFLYTKGYFIYTPYWKIPSYMRSINLIRLKMQCGNWGIMMIPRLTMLTLGLADLNKAMKFYEAVLDTPPNTYYIIFLKEWFEGIWCKK